MAHLNVFKIAARQQEIGQPQGFWATTRVLGNHKGFGQPQGLPLRINSNIQKISRIEPIGMDTKKSRLQEFD